MLRSQSEWSSIHLSLTVKLSPNFKSTDMPCFVKIVKVQYFHKTRHVWRLSLTRFTLQLAQWQTQDPQQHTVLTVPHQQHPRHDYDIMAVILPSAMAPSTKMPDSFSSQSWWKRSSFKIGRMIGRMSLRNTLASTSSAAAEHFPDKYTHNNSYTVFTIDNTVE